MVDIEIKGILEHLPHDNAHLDLINAKRTG
jgi:hypothetical protein